VGGVWFEFGTVAELTTPCEVRFLLSGDLYSVKIMWPRTAEERSRNRNTGFVCFMSRADAEDAMDALSDADPLDTGRRLKLGWGKNVKKTVRFGTGGVPTHLRKSVKGAYNTAGTGTDEGLGSSMNSRNAISAKAIKKEMMASSDQAPNGSSSNATTTSDNVQSSKHTVEMPLLGPVYNPVQHSAEAVVVTAPSNPRRFKFITTVASFVAKDGSILEQKLIETQSSNPDFQFLLPRDDSTSMFRWDRDDKQQLDEHIFYRWRVYAFAQGDGPNSWRTQPFVMFEPHGRFWVPPPLNKEAARLEEYEEKRREKDIMKAQEERKRMAEKKDYMTGAQLSRRKFANANVEKRGGIKLNDWEREKWHDLLKNKLCASQESICAAMAFAFDKSGAAIEISAMLKEALLEYNNGISVDTRIARLFLLSDILFNSQQPGVKNAFQYRDAIETMSPEVFESLGKHGDGRAGRMTMNKLRRAVSSVLSAWTNWSVYNTTFLDELQSRFEGKEVTSVKLPDQEAEAKEEEEEEDDDDVQLPPDVTTEDHAVVSNTPRGEWTSSGINDANQVNGEDIDGDALESDIDGEELEEDVDGEGLDDVDGELLDEDIDIDGEPLEEDADGEPL